MRRQPSGRPLPDGLAVMAFENNSGVRALDWVVAGIPLVIGERYTHVLGLRPMWGALVVPEGAPVIGTEDSVAAFATARGARWVVTGWVQRPAWQLRVKSSLWRVDGGKAVRVGEHDAVGGMGDAFQLLGDTMVELARQAGWTLPDGAEARLRAPASKDFYAFTLVGRGLGRWLGAVTIAAVADPDGRVPSPRDPVTGALLPAVKDAVSRDLTKAVLIEPTMVEAQRFLGELWAVDPDAKIAGRAAGKFSYAVDLRGDYVPALRAAADNARAAGKRDIALDLFSRLVRQRPWDLDARIGVGDAAWQSGDADLALRELGRVIERRPDDLKARRLLALIRGARGDVAGLARELEEVVRLAPEDMEAKVDLGAAWAELGRLEDATAILTTVAQARPADATAHIIENPYAPHFLHNREVLVTLVLIAALGAVFLKGFKEAIGLAVALVVVYIGLNLIVIAVGLKEVFFHPEVISNWKNALFSVHGNLLAMVAASAALTISGVPFMGPIGAARVGFVDGKYVLNPSMDDMQNLRANPEQRLDLLARAAQRGRRADHLGRANLAADRQLAQIVDRGLVQPDHRPERTADEMQLVLHDQLGRQQTIGHGARALGRATGMTASTV